MNVSPQSLMQALEKVRSGALSPQQAAIQLLQFSDDPQVLGSMVAFSKPVTVADLVAELGPPHPLIQQDWEQQIRQLAIEFQRNTGTAIHELTTSDLIVDQGNRLSLAPQFFNRWSAQKVQHENLLEPAFRTQVDAPETIDSLSGSPEIAIKEALPLSLQEATDSSANTDSSTKKRVKDHRSKRSPAMAWKPVASVCGGIGLLLLCVWWLGTSHDQEQISQSSADRMTHARDRMTHSRATPNAFDVGNELGSVASDRTLESAASMDVTNLAAESETSAPLVMSTDLDALGSADSLAASPSNEADDSLKDDANAGRSQLGLDSFAGGNWQSATDVLKAASSDDKQIAPEDAPESIASDELVDPIEASDEVQASETIPGGSEIVEAELATSSHVTSDQVSLPSLIRRSANEDSVALPLPLDPALQNCSLRTVDTSALKLIKDGTLWLVSVEEMRVAQIAVDAEQVEFKWLPEAYKQPAAKQLCNARLFVETGEAGKTKTQDIFLRSTVIADPFQLGFEQADNKFAWSIGDPPALAHARWQMTWHLPDSVTLHWLEPLDEIVRRRQSARCRFQSTTDESIAIDTRFDWQVGPRLQLRVRHQVASDNPVMRQPISLSRVQSAIEFCTEQLIQGELTLEQLKANYTRARTADRTLISEQRDRLEWMMSNWQSYRDRLKQYEKLLNELQKRCYLSASLQVAWDDRPNQPQVIFEIKPPEPLEPVSPPADKRDGEPPKLDVEAKRSKPLPM